jgi:hypothetical protein
VRHNLSRAVGAMMMMIMKTIRKEYKMSKSEQINKSWSQHYDRQIWIEGMSLQEYDTWDTILGAPPIDIMSIHLGNVKKYKLKDLF